MVTSITASAQAVTIVNLGTLSVDQSESRGFGVNESGDVTGFSTVPVSSTVYAPRAFRYTAGAMQNLNSLGWGSHGYGINSSGQVAGRSDIGEGGTGGPFDRAFRYVGTPGSGGVMQDLGSIGHPQFGVGAGFAINDSGQVTGWSSSSDVFGFPIGHVAFRYNGTPGLDGQMSNLGTLGGTTSEGHAINNAGDVAGQSDITGNSAIHAFLYRGTPGSGGAMADLGTLGGTSSFGRALNDLGQVAGYSQTSTGATHAFLFTGEPQAGGTMIDLGTLGGDRSEALAVNELGQVAGYSQTAGNLAEHPFLFIGIAGVEGQMIDLDVWLDANDPAEGAKWSLTRAYGLSDTGWITGYGTYDDGPGGLSDGTRAYLLDARAFVPEPQGLAVLMLAVSYVSCRTRERRRERMSCY